MLSTGPINASDDAINRANYGRGVQRALSRLERPDKAPRGLASERANEVDSDPR